MGALRDSGSQKPIPEHLITSHEPDLDLGWCSFCKAHTTCEIVIKTFESGDGRTRSRPVNVCSHCEGDRWCKPSVFQRSHKKLLGCSLVIGLITIVCFLSNKLFGFEYSTEAGLAISGVLIAVLLLQGLNFSYLYKWRKWVRSQTQTSFGSSSKPSDSQDPQG